MPRLLEELAEQFRLVGRVGRADGDTRRTPSAPRASTNASEVLVAGTPAAVGQPTGLLARAFEPEDERARRARPQDDVGTLVQRGAPGAQVVHAVEQSGDLAGPSGVLDRVRVVVHGRVDHHHDDRRLAAGPPPAG